jgi:hypothetical protein
LLNSNAGPRIASSVLIARIAQAIETGYLLSRELAEKKNKKGSDAPKLYWLVSSITMVWGSYLYPEYKLSPLWTRLKLF